MFQKRIHVFKAGDQTSAQGVARSFSAKDLDEVVKSYDPMIHEAPLVLGHQGDSDSLPSYGWIKGFERVGDNLYANVAFTDVAKDLVKDGHYRKCSISFYSPDSQINPHPGQWTARHLALLGAAPPAVKGLEPFNFAEWDQRVGVYDFAVKLDPMAVFDKDLGPTLVRDLSPLEMLKEKLDLARSEMSAAVADAVGTPEEQEEADTSADVAEAEEDASEIENPSNPANFAERPRRGDNARSVADLEDQFPEEDFNFMEEPGISRKKKSTKHGSVSQIVENVYEEGDEMHTDHEERGAQNPKMRDPRMEPGKVNYAEVSDKKNPKPGKVTFGKHAENPDERNGSFGRYDTGKSEEQQMDRYRTGKTSLENTTFGRDEIARGKEQHDAGRPAAKNSEQDKDRVSTGRYVDPDDEGRYDTMSRDQMYNNDMYDDDVDYGVNDAEVSSGRDPYGRKESETQIPTETEEMPDDTVFASKVENVTRAKNARVMQIKSSDPPANRKYAKMRDEVGDGRPANYAEPQPAEVTGKKGVYAEGKGRKKDILSGQYEGGPDEMTLKTGGVYAEGEYNSYRGEPKSSKKALTPGAFDSEGDEDPAEITGPSGVTGGADHRELPPALKKRAEEVKEKGHFAEDHKESTRERKAAADRGFEAKRQRKEGEYGKAHETEELEEMETKHAEGRGKKSMLSGQYEGGVGEETGPSGVGPGGDNPEFEEHEDEDNPYTRTGFGSTYKEEDEDMDDEFCDMGQKKMTRAYAEVDDEEEDDDVEAAMGRNYGERSMKNLREQDGDGKPAKGIPDSDEFSEFYAELQALKQENARIKQEYREAQIAHRREQIHSFVEGLYEQGKMVDSIIPERKLMEFAEGLEFGVLEFSEGETATSLLFGILNSLPNLVDFSEYAGGSMKFVDEADLDPHQKALAMVEKSGGELDYVEALKKAMYS